MIVYSQKIIRFVREIKQMVKEIISQELRLKVGNERFYDRAEKISYPINIVIYNNKTMLAYFDSNFFELGFHECLIHSNRQQLKDIVRHELAHYMTFIQYGASIQAHGPEFRKFCIQIGWGEDVSRATICLEGQINPAVNEESGVFRKVQKLMALATSSNKNEAEQAMIKSQQLLLKHNIEFVEVEDDDKVFLKRIMKQKRVDAKMRSIAKILETFFVNIVFSKGTESTYLEVLGNAVNIEIAEYVAAYLHSELDHLWAHTQKNTHLKGTVAKNSFFLGLAVGYCDKIQALKREYNTETSKALLVIENKLVEAKEMVYPRLSSTRSSSQLCRESSALGEKVGRQLTINPALNRGSNATTGLLGYIFGKT